MFVKDKIASPANPSDTNSKNLYRRYEDPSGDFGSKQLSYSLWFVKNKVLLYRILIGTLIGIAVLEWLYTLSALGVYAVVGWRRDQALNASLTNFIDYTQFYAHTAPAPLSVVSTGPLAGGVGKYDIVSEVVNPNEHFAVDVSYYFVIDGARTVSQHATILPLQDTLLPMYGLSGSGFPSSIQLMWEQTSWRRIPVRTTPDPKSYQAARLNFSIENFNYVAANSPGGIKTNVIEFDFVNQTPFSYREPSFAVGLYAHQALVGVLPLTLSSFTTAEVRHIDLRSFVDNLAVDEVKVFPLINIYDTDAFLPPPAS